MSVSQEYILGDQNEVPKARSIHVVLGTSSQLFIKGGAFRKLNRISIDGQAAGGRQQINFGPRAFHDNIALFPEINLKHAQTLNIHGNAFIGTHNNNNNITV